MAKVCQSRPPAMLQCTVRRSLIVIIILMLHANNLVVRAHGEHGKIALLVAGDTAFLQQLDMAVAVASKRCYCARHGYHFLLVENPPTHGRKPHWGRIPALVDALPRYDWVLYQDADTFVTNADVTVESMIDAALAAHETMKHKWWPLAEGSSGPFVVVQDSMEVNSGGVLIRGGGGQRETAAFLDAWWQLKDATAHFGLNDQPALQAALLSYAVRYTGFRRKHGVDPLSLCLTRQNYWQWVSCWNMWMSWMGLPLGERSIGGVVMVAGEYTFHERPAGDAEGVSIPLGTHADVPYLTQLLRSLPEFFVKQTSNLKLRSHSVLRGFNMISAHGNSDTAFHNHPTQLWHPGDFVAHVTSGPSFRYAFHTFATAVSRNITRNCSAMAPPLLTQYCYSSPCQRQLWQGTSTKYSHPNRWSQYVPAKPISYPAHEIALHHSEGHSTCAAGVCPSTLLNLPPTCHTELTSLPCRQPPEPLHSPFHLYHDVTLAAGVWRGPHLHVRLILNVTDFTPAGWRSGALAWLVVDVHVHPWEDIGSRVTDAVEVYSDFGLVYPVLRALAQNPHAVACRPGLRRAPAPPRLYVNTTNRLMQLVPAIELSGVDGLVLASM